MKSIFNLQQSMILAQYTLLEAIYTRFFFILFIFIAISFGLSVFLEQIVLFEKQLVQVALISAFLRLIAIYLLGLLVISSLTQEFNQQTIYLLMALPITRTTYIIGKLLGFAVIALIVCALFALLLFAYVSDMQLLLWIISLYFELLLIISLAIFFSISLHQTLLALSSLIGFYLLARSIYAIQLIAYEFQSSKEWIEFSLYYTTQFIALLLPDLSRFTRSEWLVYQTGNWNILLELGAQTAIYLLLVISASLFDFYRKNL
jgi:ABC-type transport system involved in multi-copper enzyme maturation permease subunit